MKYEVINQRVEINGKTRDIGSVLDASEFQEGEAESLLGTGHIKQAE